MRRIWSFFPITSSSSYRVFWIGDIGKHDSPGNSIVSFRRRSGSVDTLIISKRMQPILHMSLAWSYYLSTRLISGARYHLEPTWFDMLLFLEHLWSMVWVSLAAIFCFNSLVSSIPNLITPSRSLFVLPDPCPIALSGSDLAKPKSQSLIWQFSSIRIFAGLISRCKMLAECKNFIAVSRLYSVATVWSMLKSFFSYIKVVLRSPYIKSITINRPRWPWFLSLGATSKSISPLVWSLPGISVNHLINFISLTTFTKSYSLSQTLAMNFMATSCLVTLHLAL